MALLALRGSNRNYAPGVISQQAWFLIPPFNESEEKWLIVELHRAMSLEHLTLPKVRKCFKTQDKKERMEGGGGREAGRELGVRREMEADRPK